jgi:hypothetical protein
LYFRMKDETPLLQKQTRPGGIYSAGRVEGV